MTENTISSLLDGYDIRKLYDYFKDVEFSADDLYTYFKKENIKGIGRVTSSEIIKKLKEENYIKQNGLSRGGQFIYIFRSSENPHDFTSGKNTTVERNSTHVFLNGSLSANIKMFDIISEIRTHLIFILLDSKISNIEIARMFGLSRAAISGYRSGYRGIKTCFTEEALILIIELAKDIITDQYLDTYNIPRVNHFPERIYNIYLTQCKTSQLPR